MPINADKPHLWKKDIQASVDLFNDWFTAFAPKAYRDTRAVTTSRVEECLTLTQDLTNITAQVLRQHPAILPTLRMSACPPIARDRLAGLAHVGKGLIAAMESGRLPRRMPETELSLLLEQVAGVLTRLLDSDLFPWLTTATAPAETDRYRAAVVVADRLCGSVSDPIVRNAQEARQLALLSRYLEAKGYQQKSRPSGQSLQEMRSGTFCFRTNVIAGQVRKVNIPVDVLIQPKTPAASRFPILIEAKSAGDFTNVNKRRKEEAMKVHQLRAAYGEEIRFVLCLCGYFDSGYLGYEAAEGIDWIWEHRIEDIDQLGI